MQAWRLGLKFPIGSAIIAALGFVLAAMWIDTIATELVSMLEYLGLLSGISHTVCPFMCSHPSHYPCLALTDLLGNASFSCNAPEFSSHCWGEENRGCLLIQGLRLSPGVRNVSVCAGVGTDSAGMGQFCG